MDRAGRPPIEVRAATKREANEIAAQLVVDPSSFVPAPAIAGRRPSSWTVADYAADRYFPARIDWSSGTRRARANQLKYVARSPLADASVATVSKADVAAFLSWLTIQHGRQTNRPLSYKTIDGVYSLLQGMFRFAAEDGVRPTRLDMPKMPKVAKDGRRLVQTADVVPPTKVEVAALLRWLERDRLARRFAPMLALAVQTGMRTGEIRALRWSRIRTRPDGKRTIRIDATADDRKGGGLMDTKSKRSNRTIVITPAAAAILDRLDGDRLDGDSDFVFPNDRNAGPWSSDVLGKYLDQAAAEAKAPGATKTIAEQRKADQVGKLSPHDFRHYFVTDRLLAGHTTAVVAKYVGDTERVIQSVYTHWIGDAAIDDGAVSI